jgi:hypothetical protein
MALLVLLVLMIGASAAYVRACDRVVRSGSEDS